MTAAALADLLLIAALAAYMQTLTGFALGLIMMGGVGLTGLLPLPDAAVLVSLLVIVNAAQVLARGWRDIAWPQFLPALAASLVFQAIGYWLLNLMASASLDWVKLVLGLVIVVSSIQLSLKPEALQQLSSSVSFAGFGAIAGVMGGMFSTAGPPLIYHFYRQPLRPAVVRETLVAIFATNAVVRLGIVAGVGKLPSASFWWGLLAIPVVIGATWLAKRFPPPLSPLAMRRLAFLMLFLSGLSLALPSILRLV
ncbi:TSUP family transporter [Rhizobium oryzicola]|uniref:Probable membrane transporter protein n=1 Tax=Rhizobium oryzicola TaxID=1232668 RepID=A0ABT8SWP7_9HYPH|nr:TSUP family transporter [Rhizobium oryzicola]MDO1582849.1 TSUP family transporter [Rhizobium oryzicola]